MAGETDTAAVPDPATPEAEPAPAGDGLAAAVAAQLTRYFAGHAGGEPPPGLYARVLREMEVPLFCVTLRATGGNQLQAARILGINRNTLRRKLRDLDLGPKDWGR